MINPILLFDIDYTLFDTDIFRNISLIEIATQYRLEESAVRQFYATYREGTQAPIGINMKHFTEHIGKEFGLSPDLLFATVMHTEKLYRNSLYPDTLSTLTLLAKDYSLGIFSQGYREFQENKLKQCGIYPFFAEEYTFIFPDKTLSSALKTLPENAVIIEDKLSVVQMINPPRMAVHMDRSGTKEYTPRVDSLAELPSLLTRLL